MGSLNYLNLGCGHRFHEDWVNMDMVSSSPYVISYNILKGVPYPDNQFDVVYHAQVLEHIPKEKAPAFIKECFRVLKPGGIIRIVVPNLENIVYEYVKHLNENLENPTEESEANYDWILLEMYDQTVRNYVGGEMAKYINNPKLINEEYVLYRTGMIGANMRDKLALNFAEFKNGFTIRKVLRQIKSSLQEKVKHFISSPASRIGAFRLSGEVHMWMYDRYSLSRLLKKAGFEDIRIKSPFESDIARWSDYELDIKKGKVLDHTSLFMEAKKLTTIL